MTAGFSAPHLDEYQCAIAAAHDQINFATATPGGFEISRHEHQTMPQQMLQSQLFSAIAHRFGGDIELGCSFCRYAS